MKKTLIIVVTLLLIIVCIFSVSGVILAQEENAVNEEQAVPVPPTEEQKSEDVDLRGFNPFHGVDVGGINETQMALLMISRQIEYLMEQNEKTEKQVVELGAQYQKLVDKEIARQKEMREEHAAEMELLQNKLDEKEVEISAAKAEAGMIQAEVHRLEKLIATYIGESGLYFKLLIALIAGVLFGLILSSILNWRRNKNNAAAAI